MNAQDLRARLTSKFPELEPQAYPAPAAYPADVVLRTPRQSLERVAEYLRDDPEMRMDYLSMITAVDWRDRFEMVYHLVSLPFGHEVILKVDLPERDRPSVASLTRFYEGADWQEREVYDLFGIHFENHPNLKRILLPEDFPAVYPMRKDYVHQTDRYD